MKKAGFIVVLLSALLVAHAVLGGVDYVTYNADIKPILDEKCVQCHSESPANLHNRQNQLS